jgi:hypothetical protein
LVKRRLLKWINPVANEAGDPHGDRPSAIVRSEE